MLTKERERLMKAARDLRGSMLIESVKSWKRGETSDARLLSDTQGAVEAVQAVEKQLRALEPQEAGQHTMAQKPEQPKEKPDAKA